MILKDLSNDTSHDGFLIVMFWALTCFLLLVTSVSPKPLDDDMLLYWRRSNTEACSPFSTYMVDCNKCVCSAEGVPFCTRMACMTKVEDKLQHKEYSDEID
ncbi:hypothetical protein ABMA28_003189 [Loxostege sticticalis]|uniref:Pacifastin domain-containing protein n=1 Tax=Loxostege sticticalis TaxID=481309 RepID=A0ABD0SV98_LOXSC